MDFGFPQSISLQSLIDHFYFIVLFLGILTTGLRYATKKKSLRVPVFAVDLITVAFSILLLYMHLFNGVIHSVMEFLFHYSWVQLAVVITFIREFAEQKINIKRTWLNPAQLFIASFLMIILLGTLLLLLPNATYSNISFIDALFTSTSAVCVTGLIVVDTGSYFTLFGQSIILLLFQIGGIGILTFASYFSYFFKGGSNYENHLVLSEILNSRKIGEVFSLIRRILFITFSIELIGAMVLFTTLPTDQFQSFFERLYFSVFHAVSAFCNAGFSTLSQSFASNGFQFNYPFQIVIIALIVFGGLGFPIVVNLLRYLRYVVSRRILSLIADKPRHRPWVLNMNSRIAIVTTLLLIVVGSILFFISELNGVLEEHSVFGKFVTSLFGAVTPRTAGFNTVEMEALGYSTLLLTVILMWIGASPASTGGGIKTNTFAVAILNVLSLARGKTRIELFRREIAQISVSRAFAVMALSILVIGGGIVGLALSDPGLQFRNIVFECFSAYSTVGLSLGITADLSHTGKFIIIGVMFIGRVSMLSIMIAMFKDVRTAGYRYPKEEIIIN